MSTRCSKEKDGNVLLLLLLLFVGRYHIRVDVKNEEFVFEHRICFDDRERKRIVAKDEEK